jgi:Histidine kinase-, DNA gyrase B-, and HSP90-like ATPase
MINDVAPPIALPVGVRVTGFRSGGGSELFGGLPSLKASATRRLPLCKSQIANHSPRYINRHRGCVQRAERRAFIAPEERLRIFQRFFRSPGSQHKAPGTGIGLSVAKRIAEAHTGRVRVESDPEAHTTFFFALPRIRKET